MGGISNWRYYPTVIKQSHRKSTPFTAHRPSQNINLFGLLPHWLRGYRAIGSHQPTALAALFPRRDNGFSCPHVVSHFTYWIYIVVPPVVSNFRTTHYVQRKNTLKTCSTSGCLNPRIDRVTNTSRKIHCLRANIVIISVVVVVAWSALQHQLRGMGGLKGNNYRRV